MRGMRVLLFTTGDAADAIGERPGTVAQWASRGHGPVPDYISTDGHRFWLDLDGWREWHGTR